MKADRLKKMQLHGIRVPRFIIVNADKIDKYQLDNSLKGIRAFAVRSSSKLEDSNNESHAGEFKTILNVTQDGLIDAIQEVKSSYTNNSDNTVIIQEMVDSDISGVMFTANPLGILSEILIEVGYGLGDNVVDNKKSTTLYVYNTESKEFAIRRKEDATPELDRSLLDELITQGKRIEKLFKCKCDIEFAIKDNEIFILQSRPITTIKRNISKIILDNSNIVESYPGVSLPLTQDFVKGIYADIFKNCILRLTEDNRLVKDIESNLDEMVDTVNWHFYYRISNWYLALKLLPFSNIIIHIWQNMLGVKNRYVGKHAIDITIRQKLRIIKNFKKYLKRTPFEMDKLNKNFDTKLEQFEVELLNTSTIRGLLELYKRARKEFLNSWDITLINDMYAFIYTFLAGKKNISSIPDLASKNQVKSLNKLIDTYRKLGNTPEFEKEFTSYIQKYGDRCIGELKLETLTFRTNPNRLMDYIDKASKSEGVDNIDKADTDIKGGGVFVKRAKVGIKNREESRLNRSRLFGFTRSIFLKIGDILVNQDILENNTDIFYLYIKEIEEIISTSDICYRGLVTDRKKQEKKFKSMSPPSRIIFSGAVKNVIQLSSRYDINDNTNKEFLGEGVSSGDIEWVTGEVVVIYTPDINLDTTNKIIVTPMTDPGWSLLIMNSKGIITEQGSMLSHTAIISRELRKPAIVNVDKATQLFKTGDIVKINGVTGEIIKIG